MEKRKNPHAVALGRKGGKKGGPARASKMTKEEACKARDAYEKNIEKIREMIDKSKDSEKIKMGTNWLFEPTINFYRQTNNINWLIPADRSGISPEDDYFYIFKDELYQLNPENFKILFEFNKTNTLLLKNNNSNSVE